MVLLALSVVLALTIAPISAATTVRITPAGFLKDSVAIRVGDTVRWENADMVPVRHQVVADDGSFRSPVLAPGDAFSFTFRRPGTFAYHDALVSKIRGTVTVTGAARRVTIVPSTPIVVYGGRVRLSGVVSSREAGEEVALLARRHNRAAFSRLGAVTTSAGGTWSYVAEPTIRTVFRARWEGAALDEVTVRVRPRVSLTVRHGVFSTHAEAARSFVGKTAYFQRRSAVGRWISVKEIVLDAHSSARFRAKIRAGSAVRVLVPRTQAGPGYLAGMSRALLYPG